MLLLHLFLFFASLISAAKRRGSGKDKSGRNVRQRTLRELSARRTVLTSGGRMTLAIKRQDLKTVKSILEENDMVVDTNMILAAAAQDSIDCLKIITDVQYMLNGKFDPTLIDAGLLQHVALNSAKAPQALFLLNFIVASDDLHELTVASARTGSFQVTMRLLEISGWNLELMLECFKESLCGPRKNTVLACLLYKKLAEDTIFEDVEELNHFIERYEMIKKGEEELTTFTAADFHIAFSCGKMAVLEDLIKRTPLRVPMPSLVDHMVYSGAADMVGKLLQCKFVKTSTDSSVAKATKLVKLDSTIVSLANGGDWNLAADFLLGLPQAAQTAWFRSKKADRRCQIGLKLILQLRSSMKLKSDSKGLFRHLPLLICFTGWHPQSVSLLETAWSTVFNPSHDHWKRLAECALSNNVVDTEFDEDMDTVDEDMEDLTPTDDVTLTSTRRPAIRSDCILDCNDSSSDCDLS